LVEEKIDERTTGRAGSEWAEGDYCSFLLHQQADGRDGFEGPEEAEVTDLIN